jgi:glucoamylase
MTRMASSGGMLPEQVWDTAPIARRGLSPGRPTGAAMPLVWAHAEYLKLAASRLLKRPFDRPESVWQRYQGQRPQLTRVVWTEQAPVSQLPAGCGFLIALREAGAVRFSLDNGQGAQERATTANSLGLHTVQLDTAQLQPGRVLDFTLRRGTAWVDTSYQVRITPRAAAG